VDWHQGYDTPKNELYMNKIFIYETKFSYMKKKFHTWKKNFIYRRKAKKLVRFT